jgi:hypothetical protein
MLGLLLIVFLLVELFSWVKSLDAPSPTDREHKLSAGGYTDAVALSPTFFQPSKGYRAG